MPPQLTEGALKVIMSGGQVEKPIMQVLSSKQVNANQPDKMRFRLLLSDGIYTISFAMVTTHISDQNASGEIPDYSVIRVNNYITSVINNTGRSGEKRVLVILSFDILLKGDAAVGKIGNPVPLPDVLTQESGSAAAQKTSNGSTNGSSLGAAKPALAATPNLNESVLETSLINPISSISPYSNKWVIKARVANKSGIRSWSNSRGEGKLFSMDLVDTSGEIRATVFRDLVDKYYSMMEVDKIYYISKCQVKIANKNFSSLKNDFELTFNNDTQVQECQEVDTTIPTTQFNFMPIDKIANIEVNTMIDTIGVCKTTGDVFTFQSKTSGRELKKREITLVDRTNSSVTLTLWGDDAEKFDGSTQPVIAIKGAKVGEFGGGKNLSLFSSSIMKLNPDIPEAHTLRGWFDNEGRDKEASNISARTGGGFQTQWMSFLEAQDSGLGNGEKGDYYQVMGTVMLIRSENCVYKSCASEQCNKKVVDLENGMYRCEKCNREYSNFKYRLMLSANIGDWSGNQWVTMFNDEAQKVIGMTAQELGTLMENDKEAAINSLDKVHFKQFIFKCRAKIENYNDESRLKTIVVKVDPINYKDYNQYLLGRIDLLNA